LFTIPYEIFPFTDFTGGKQKKAVAKRHSLTFHKAAALPVKGRTDTRNGKSIAF
jgi:hypothetical protein